MILYKYNYIYRTKEMGKHRTGRKVTGAQKMERNSYLGQAAINAHKDTRREHYGKNAPFNALNFASRTEEPDFAEVL